MTREKAIDILISNHYFDITEIGTSAIEFYIKDMVETDWDSISDIDRHVHLNTLFGYNIGFKNAMLIDGWLWGSVNEKGNYRDIDTLDISYKDKELIQLAVIELGLTLSFDNWKETDFYYYSFNFD